MSHFFCHLLESGLARINWIRAVYQFCVEQLICCQKCRATACRAIAIRAVHPHSPDCNTLRKINLADHFDMLVPKNFFIYWEWVSSPKQGIVEKLLQNVFWNKGTFLKKYIFEVLYDLPCIIIFKYLTVFYKTHLLL